MTFQIACHNAARARGATAMSEVGAALPVINK